MDFRIHRTFKKLMRNAEYEQNLFVSPRKFLHQNKHSLISFSWAFCSILVGGKKHSSLKPAKKLTVCLAKEIWEFSRSYTNGQNYTWTSTNFRIFLEGEVELHGATVSSCLCSFCVAWALWCLYLWCGIKDEKTGAFSYLQDRSPRQPLPTTHIHC